MQGNEIKINYLTSDSNDMLKAAKSGFPSVEERHEALVQSLMKEHGISRKNAEYHIKTKA